MGITPSDPPRGRSWEIRVRLGHVPNDCAVHARTNSRVSSRLLHQACDNDHRPSRRNFNSPRPSIAKSVMMLVRIRLTLIQGPVRLCFFQGRTTANHDQTSRASPGTMRTGPASNQMPTSRSTAARNSAQSSWRQGGPRASKTWLTTPGSGYLAPDS